MFITTTLNFMLTLFTERNLCQRAFTAAVAELYMIEMARPLVAAVV